MYEHAGLQCSAIQLGRRHLMDNMERLQVGEWAVLPARNLLERDGRSVRLKPLAMDVLVYLARHAGSVVSANELIESVWQGRVVGDGTIYQIINQLRKALGDGPKQITYIETISKRGYRLVAAVPPTDQSGFESGRKQVRSLVVLPFTNLSSDPEQEYFADGMTEVLIANLAKVRALRIISRTSAMRYKGSHRSLPDIAEELNVDAVVEGSVLREGQRVRITTQLIHAATDLHLWAESYERGVEDILILQSEVAQAVADEIQVAVTPDEKEILASARRVHPAAYEGYLKGRFHYWKVTPHDFDKAVEYFSQALDKDPDYALAFAYTGDVWGARGCFGLVSPNEAFSMGNPAALKAVELDDGLAEGYEVLARFRFFYDWDWAAVESKSRQAMALSPNNPDIGFAYWWLLIATKQFARATEQAERALSLDPFNSTFQWVLGWQLLLEHRYDEAIAQLKKIVATEPNFPWAHWTLWSAYHRAGMPEQALAAARQFLTLIGAAETAQAMERSHAKGGYQLAMLHGAEHLVAQTKARYVQTSLIARFYAHARENDLALDWLEKGDPWSALIYVDVDWDNLREEPRFVRLQKKMGLEK